MRKIPLLLFVLITAFVISEVSAEVEITPKSIDFGTFFLQDQNQTSIFRIRNSGTTKVTFTLEVTKAPFTVSPESGTISPSAQAIVAVSVPKTASVGDYEGSVRVLEQSRLLGEVSLKAKVRFPFSLSTALLDFGTIQVGQSKALTLSINNLSEAEPGTFNLKIGAESSPFTLSTPTVTIEPGKSETITVTLQADAVGSLSAPLSIEIQNYAETLTLKARVTQ